MTWGREHGAPGDRIVAQGFEALGGGRFRYWNRWDTGVDVWEDRIASGFHNGAGGWVSSYQSCGTGRGRAPIHVKMVSTAELKAAIGSTGHRDQLA